METLRELDLVRAIPAQARPMELRAAGEDGTHIMVVRFSPFGTWYEIDSYWEGTFLERTIRGAFRKTISESRPSIKTLYDHGYDPQIGNKVLGTIADLREDADSAVSEVELFDTSYNRDLLPGLAAGVYGSSFRFRVIKDEWNDEPGVSAYNPKGLPERTITEVRLFEAGPVTWPANPDATSGLRSLTDLYYERVRSRDPQFVDELRSRVQAIRTPAVSPAAVSTSREEPETVDVTADRERAATPTDEPAARHSGGFTHAQRRVRLYPFLTKEGASS